jgi:hypothetical protein
MKTYIALLAVALGACTAGQGQADVTMENSVTFAGAPAGIADVPVPAGSIPMDGAVTVDVHDEIESMSKLGTLTATVSKNALSGPSLAAIQHIRSTIATEDGKLPVELLTDVDVPAGTTELELPLLVSGAQILDYLQEGKVSIHFYVTGGILPQAITLTHTLIAHVDVAVQGSVLKL